MALFFKYIYIYICTETTCGAEALKTGLFGLKATNVEKVFVKRNNSCSTVSNWRHVRSVPGADRGKTEAHPGPGLRETAREVSRWVVTWNTGNGGEVGKKVLRQACQANGLRLKGRVKAGLEVFCNNSWLPWSPGQKEGKGAPHPQPSHSSWLASLITSLPRVLWCPGSKGMVLIFFNSSLDILMQIWPLNLATNPGHILKNQFLQLFSEALR